jgi:hypothetical protein
VGLVSGIALLVVLAWPRPGGSVAAPSNAGPPGRTFNLPAALDAQVDEAGLMRSGGIWAVQGSYLLTSTDDGVSWNAGVIPTPDRPGFGRPVFVLDRDHAWAITSSASTAGNGVGDGVASPAPSGWSLVVNRTTDGGRTWLATSVSGGFACDSATLSFVDAADGFLMCTVASTTVEGGASVTAATEGSGTVLRTDDGGASWSLCGGATGLGSQFMASDGTTLWSAPDYASSTLTGTSLMVSHDAGLTWSRVDLPGLASVAKGAEVGVLAGPVFPDSSDGAIAVGVDQDGSGTPPAIWFFRTSDAGRSWTVVKRPTLYPAGPVPAALVGREWATTGLDGYDGMTVSSDFGASWQRVAWSGLPPNSPPSWLDFADEDDAAATVFAEPGVYALMLSSDGGLTWHPADFGNARAKVPADPVQDPVAARNTADDFETMAIKDPPTAWNMLSSYSQRAFGSYSGFAALATRTSYGGIVGEPTQDAALRNRLNLTAEVWDDINTFADMSRAYVVIVTFPDTSNPPRTLVVAPLSITGDWRVWVVGQS